jgi:hypothetical protein
LKSTIIAGPKPVSTYIRKSQLAREQEATKKNTPDFDEQKVAEAVAKNNAWEEAKKLARDVGYSGSLQSRPDINHVASALPRYSKGVPYHERAE